MLVFLLCWGGGTDLAFWVCNTIHLPEGIEASARGERVNYCAGILRPAAVGVAPPPPMLTPQKTVPDHPAQDPTNAGGQRAGSGKVVYTDHVGRCRICRTRACKPEGFGRQKRTLKQRWSIELLFQEELQTCECEPRGPVTQATKPELL